MRVVFALISRCAVELGELRGSLRIVNDEQVNAGLYSIWGFSSSGRAPALQAGGERFDPVNLHQEFNEIQKQNSKFLTLLSDDNKVKYFGTKIFNKMDRVRYYNLPTRMRSGF